MFVMIGADMLGLSTNFELLFLSLALGPAKESLARFKGICCLTGSPFSALVSLVMEVKWVFELLLSLNFLMLLFDT